MNFRFFCTCKLIIGILIIWAVKLYFRPKAELHSFSNFVLGVAPNLLGSYLLLFGTYLWRPMHFVFSSASRLKWVCMCYFGLLTINEYLQKIPLFGRTFDYYDILASVFGLYFSYILFVNWTKDNALQGSNG